MHRPRPSLPIVEHLPVEPSASERRKIEQIARKLLGDEPTLGSTEAFGPGIAAGLGPWPALTLEDHSAIGLFDPDGDLAYAYRALLLADDGDLVAVGVERNLEFERYCRDLLGLGTVEVVVPRPAPRQRSFAGRCAADRAVIRRLAATAEAAGGLNLIPYMGTGGIWALAGRIAARSGAPVRVGAPPPRLCRRVNDKLWFGERVAELLGREAQPPARPVFSLPALARALKLLARHHASVAIKVPDSAGSVGNFVLAAGGIARRPATSLAPRLAEMLSGAGWRGDFPLLATGWEQPVVASPSVQIWIPTPADGPPIVEGVFEQLLSDTGAVFAGAVPSSLPRAAQARLAHEAAVLASLFQTLGYYGRCSFDAILVGDDPAEGELHWVECNGRWGGVSIPMTLANRLVGDWRRRPLVILDRSRMRGVGQPFAIFLERLNDALFVTGRQERGLVMLAPGRLETGTGFEVMVLGDTVGAARAGAEVVCARLEAIMTDTTATVDRIGAAHWCCSGRGTTED